jgi:UDP-N-acetylmuramyl pentapeptide phosphotransferase/UDP-N-acetylglucosamine-1-phosphate transferase
MNIVVAFALGLVAVRVLWFMSRPLFAVPGLQRSNYRNVALPTAGGVLLVGVALVSAAFQTTLNAFNLLLGSVGAEGLVCFAVIGYGFLGFWDDVLGASDTTGFKGHLRALVRGHITTGAVKLFGGGLLALVLVAERSSGWQFVADAALIALAANFANLLDRRPGRVLKVALAAYIPLALIGGTGPLGLALAPIFGAAAGLLPEDLRERMMLGDTGANILGGVLGLGCVYFCSPAVRIVVLFVLIALNVLSEFVSYTKIIAAVPPLRFIDALGRSADTPA